VILWESEVAVEVVVVVDVFLESGFVREKEIRVIRKRNHYPSFFFFNYYFAAALSRR
jgi:hypothetical protein